MTEPWYIEPTLAQDVRDAASKLADAESNHAIEYLRLIALGDPSFVANKKADLVYGRAVILARAEYEIALVRLRR